MREPEICVLLSRENVFFLEKFTPLAKLLHCRRQWQEWQISPLKWTLFKLSPGSPTCQRWWSSGQRLGGPWGPKRWELKENNKGWLMWGEILQNPGLIDQPLGPQMSEWKTTLPQKRRVRHTVGWWFGVVCHNQCPSSGRWQPSPLSYSSSSQVQYLYTTLNW